MSKRIIVVAVLLLGGSLSASRGGPTGKEAATAREARAAALRIAMADAVEARRFATKTAAAAFAAVARAELAAAEAAELSNRVRSAVVRHGASVAAAERRSAAIHADLRRAVRRTDSLSRSVRQLASSTSAVSGELDSVEAQADSVFSLSQSTLASAEQLWLS